MMSSSSSVMISLAFALFLRCVVSSSSSNLLRGDNSNNIMMFNDVDGSSSSINYQYESEHPCYERLWHLDITAASPTCTNTIGNYSHPSSWSMLLPMMHGVTMFDTPIDCCDRLLFNNIIHREEEGTSNKLSCFIKEADDCTYYNNKVESGRSKSSLTTRRRNRRIEEGGTTTSDGRRELVPSGCSCEDNKKWHVSKTQPETCTNDEVYPSSWDDDSQFLGKTMFLTPYECCTSLYSYGATSCNIINICDTPLLNGGIQSTYPWHPNSVTFEGCSNSPPGTYPTDWMNDNNVTIRNMYIYESHEECCLGYYNYDNLDCPKVDYCNSNQEVVDDTTPSSTSSLTNDDSDCNNNKYHPTNVNERTCINNDVYPKIWEYNYDKFFYTNGEDCCNEFYNFGGGGGGLEQECEVVNVCSTDNNE